MNCKNNTRYNSNKGEQVQKVVIWHWRIVISEKMTVFLSIDMTPKKPISKIVIQNLDHNLQNNS